MAEPQPNEKIDGLLKAYAARRNEQAGPDVELQPILRKRLHNELKRRFAGMEHEEPGRWGIPAFWWPRIYFAGTVVALLILMCFFSLPMFRVAKQEIASIKRKRWVSTNAVVFAEQTKQPGISGLGIAATPSAGKPALAKTTTNTASSATPLVATTDKVDLAAHVEIAEKKQPAASPIAARDEIAATTAVPPAAMPAEGGNVAVAPPQTSVAAVTTDETTSGQLSSNGTPSTEFQAASLQSSPAGSARRLSGLIAAGEPAPAVLKDAKEEIPAYGLTNETADVPALDQSGFADDMAAGVARIPANQPIASLTNVTLKFVQIIKPDNESKSQTSQSLLASFQIERTGPKIRITDTDGSVYEGQVINEVAATENRKSDSVVPSGGGGGGGGGFGGAYSFKSENRRGGGYGRRGADLSMLAELPAPPPASLPVISTLKIDHPENKFSFNVSGFNNRLFRYVVFTGSVGISTNDSFTVTRAAKVSGQSLLLTGKVQLGDNDPYQIEAASAP